MTATTETTQILEAISQGDTSGFNRLVELVYTELHRMAAHYLRRENPDPLLKTTALVHEAYLKLVDQRHVHWQGRSHFMAVGAQAMRRILVDNARARLSQKRGGGQRAIPLKEDLVISIEHPESTLALDEVLQKLEQIDADDAKMVEMRYFCDMTMGEIAEALRIPKRTVERRWTFLKAWLSRELSEESPA